MTTAVFPVPQLDLEPVPALSPARYRAWVDGRLIEVRCTNVAEFFEFTWRQPVEIVIEADRPVLDACLRPLSRGLTSHASENRLTFRLERAQNLCVDLPGSIPLFIYASPEETNRPDPSDPRVHYFRAGQVHEVGELHLKSGETLYVEAGAVVKGRIVAREADNLRLCGRGILDGSLGLEQPAHFVVFERCTNILVEDLIMIEPRGWMLVFGACRGVHVRNVRQIGEIMCSDGIDICGSKDVLVEGCCMLNNDDNIAIKAITVNAGRFSWEEDVENVLVRDCMLWNAQCGNAMEIGYELRAGRISNVVFENIDVLCVHGHGAPFSIHNGDRAVVENIRWENIRVEHHWDKLVDFRVVNSRYSKDAERGRIRQVVLRNIRIMHTRLNEGCTVSLIGGFDRARPVTDVVFEDFYLGERKVKHADEMDLYLRHACEINFR